METVGQRIRKLRKANNWTQEQLATRVSVSPQKVSNWERGYTPPSVDDVAKIAEICQVNPDYILTGQSNTSTDKKSGQTSSLHHTISLTPTEIAVLDEMKKYPVFFNDLASDPSKIRKVIKMWEFIKADIENDNDEEPED